MTNNKREPIMPSELKSTQENHIENGCHSLIEIEENLRGLSLAMDAIVGSGDMTGKESFFSMINANIDRSADQIRQVYTEMETL